VVILQVNVERVSVFEAKRQSQAAGHAYTPRTLPVTLQFMHIEPQDEQVARVKRRVQRVESPGYLVRVDRLNLC
jgi:hypothetical protein